MSNDGAHGGKLSRRLIGVVFRKEVLDNLRDKRTLAAALFYPLFGPLLLIGILAVVANATTERIEKPLELPISGAEHAPSLVAFLKQHNVIVKDAPDDPEAAIKAGDEDVVLLIPEDFGTEFRGGVPATVRLVMDDSREASQVAIRRAEGLLEGYGRQIGVFRLWARGVNPAITQAVAVERASVATSQSQAARFLGMAPYFIVFSIFMGGMYLAIDSTAGERERGSLEPLLINPASRADFVLGKYAAVLLFTLAAVVETLLALSLLLNYIPVEKYLGIRFSLSGSSVLGIFLISIPMMLLAAALQLLIATFTRSFKEAQNYLSLLMLVPLLPGMFLALLPVKANLQNMLIPTFGQQILMNRLMRGEGIEALHVGASAASTLLLSLLLLGLTIWLYGRERTVFGR